MDRCVICRMRFIRLIREGLLITRFEGKITADKIIHIKKIIHINRKRHCSPLAFVGDARLFLSSPLNRNLLWFYSADFADF